MAGFSCRNLEILEAVCFASPESTAFVYSMDDGNFSAWLVQRTLCLAGQQAVQGMKKVATESQKQRGRVENLHKSLPFFVQAPPNGSLKFTQECLATFVSLIVNLTHNSKDRCIALVRQGVQTAAARIVKRLAISLARCRGKLIVTDV